jgi:signal transduction histidine kinase
MSPALKPAKFKLEAKKMSIRLVLEPIVEEFKIVAKEKGLYLKLSIPSSLPQVPLDAEKINQVLMNVVDNAIKYTEKGGIEIRVREKGKNAVLIEIADTGLGMDKGQTNKIFEKFSRGTAGEVSWASGAGLGLFIAKKFTELHHGKIWAESKGINKGSTFYIELPEK